MRLWGYGFHLGHYLMEAGEYQDTTVSKNFIRLCTIAEGINNNLLMAAVQGRLRPATYCFIHSWSHDISLQRKCLVVHRDIRQPIVLHCNSFPVFRVSLSECLVWNMPYKDKNVCTVRLKFSHMKRRWLHTRLFESTSTYVQKYCQIMSMLFTQPLNGSVIFGQ
jgi:hypothetical protein